MNRAWIPIGVALAATSAGCGSAPPRDQWLVFVGTDAPVPALGQQLLVEILDQSGQLQSPAAKRFIDASHPASWPISFGIVPGAGGTPPRIRVRLYRLDETGSDGLPSGSALLDATATLPLPDQLTRVGMALRMTCFGMPANPATKQTCDPDTKQLAAEPTLPPGFAPETLPAPGAWTPSVPVPCSAPAPSGMTCISGGAFLLGSQQYFPSGADFAPLPQHLVVLAPFAIDTAEVTVGQIRPLVQAGVLSAPTVQGARTGASMRSEECTYAGADESSNDGAPANCLPWSAADLACRSMGKRLPTEAEWEYAARNLDQETPYPWGSDPSVCDLAVVARGVGVFADPTECEPLGSGVSPGPVSGGAPADVTALGVLNLGGNVSEWVADFFAPYSAPCWSGGSPLVDPSCQTPSTSHAVRGGSWQSAVSEAQSTARSAPATDDASEAIGFRCAESM